MAKRTLSMNLLKRQIACRFAGKPSHLLEAGALLDDRGIRGRSADSERLPEMARGYEPWGGVTASEGTQLKLSR